MSLCSMNSQTPGTTGFQLARRARWTPVVPDVWKPTLHSAAQPSPARGLGTPTLCDTALFGRLVSRAYGHFTLEPIPAGIVLSEVVNDRRASLHSRPSVPTDLIQIVWSAGGAGQICPRKFRASDRLCSSAVLFLWLVAILTRIWLHGFLARSFRFLSSL